MLYTASISCVACWVRFFVLMWISVLKVDVIKIITRLQRAVVKGCFQQHCLKAYELCFTALFVISPNLKCVTFEMFIIPPLIKHTSEADEQQKMMLKETYEEFCRYCNCQLAQQSVLIQSKIMTFWRYDINVGFFCTKCIGESKMSCEI